MELAESEVGAMVMLLFGAVAIAVAIAAPVSAAVLAKLILIPN